MPGTTRTLVFLRGAAALALPVTSAQAQVNGPGPSDPALFDTVINLPVDQATIAGSVGNELGDATPTTQLNLADGGTIESGFNAYTGSEVNVSGGTIGSDFQAQTGSEVNISGGRIGDDFNALAGSNVTLVGGDFRLNGQVYTQPTIDLTNRGDVFSGTFTDGSLFVLSAFFSDSLENVSLVSGELPTIDTTPIVVDTNVTDTLFSLNRGQTLTLEDGGVLPDGFEAVGATIDFEGGSFFRIHAVDSVVNFNDDNLDLWIIEASGQSTININGGVSFSTKIVRHDSKLNITDLRHGGSSRFWAELGGEINIIGGTVGRSIRARDGGTINISGGTIVGTDSGIFRDGVEAFADGIVNVSGGNFSNTFFEVLPDGQLNFFGMEFQLDGVSLGSDLVLGEAFTLEERGGAVLTGNLADGNTFSIELNENGNTLGFDKDTFVAPSGILTLTLVSELAGDYNSDGFISQADLDLVLLNWGETVLPFEFNQAGLDGGPFDGLVSQNELDAVLLNWGDGTAPNLSAIPEPATAGVVLLGLACVARRGRRWR